MKKIINVDRIAIEQESRQLEENKNRLQVIVTELSKNGINDLTAEDIMPLCSTTELFIVERLTKNMPTTFGGLPIKKESIFSIAEKPEFVDTVVNYANENYNRIKISGYAQYLTIKNNKVSITKDALEIFTERYTNYAESPNQIETLDKYMAVIDALNALNDDLTAPICHERFGVLEQRIEFNSFENKFVLIPHHIKSLK